MMLFAEHPLVTFLRLGWLQLIGPESQLTMWRSPVFHWRSILDMLAGFDHEIILRLVAQAKHAWLTGALLSARLGCGLWGRPRIRASIRASFSLARRSHS